MLDGDSADAGKYAEIDRMLREIEGQWPKGNALRQTRWYHNLDDEARRYFDRKIDELDGRR